MDEDHIIRTLLIAIPTGTLLASLYCVWLVGAIVSEINPKIDRIAVIADTFEALSRHSDVGVVYRPDWSAPPVKPE